MTAMNLGLTAQKVESQEALEILQEIIKIIHHIKEGSLNSSCKLKKC